MTAAERGFSELRLRGGRYERPGYPVETLGELARYERLVIDVARGLWKSSHPSRTRLPKGFTDRLQLRLTGIDRGSVVPVLRRDTISGPTDSLINEIEGIFERARDLIEDSVQALAQGVELPAEMPPDALHSFVRFGSSLREDESIEFASLRRGSRVIYNQSVRRRLAARTSVERFQEAGSTVGRVTEVNAEGGSFTFVTLVGVPLAGQYSDSALTSDFISVLNSLANAPVVRVDGTLIMTAANEAVAIEDVRSVELFELDTEPWSSRFVELLSLRRGWLDQDGSGAEVSFAALDFAREVLTRCSASGSVMPGIFPTPEGGVQLEWKIDSKLVSIEIDPDSKAELYRVDIESGDDNPSETTDPQLAYQFAAEVIT